MAEELADYLMEMGIKTHYLHSEIDTLQRVEILRDLRLGVYDVVVGINLLREGLDLPEVSLVAILDADKEGYLRSEGAYPDHGTSRPPHRRSCNHVRRYYYRLHASGLWTEIKRRRKIQEDYNDEHGITPQGIRKAIKDITERVKQVAEPKTPYRAEAGASKEDVVRLIKDLELQMKAAAKNLEFERAALLRDKIIDLRKEFEFAEIKSGKYQLGDPSGTPGKEAQEKARPNKAAR